MSHSEVENRRKARTVKIGNVTVGGTAPVAIQSMTFTKTSDREATLAQILELEKAGWKKGDDGIYAKNGTRLSFKINCGEGDQVRIDMATICAEQLRSIGVEASVAVNAKTDWAGQETYLIGWGSPFDADDHTYKVFGTDKGANYSGYSNAAVDSYLKLARETSDPEQRRQYYAKFQEALAADPAYAFICCIDANYVAVDGLQGIAADTVLGHHGVGIFWNVQEWTIEK